MTTHLVLVLGLELQEPADVEQEGEEDEGDHRPPAHPLPRGHVRVADGEVALHAHGQGAVDGAWRGENKSRLCSVTCGRDETMEI